MHGHFLKPFHRPSSFLRAALPVYVFLIVYASLYPFEGWRFAGVFPLAYLGAPFPRYWTVFDVLVNIAGYIPLGVLLATAVSPRLRGIKALLFAFAAGTLLSFSMEALQAFLPSRVSSNLDLATNAAGVLIGAIAGIFLSPALFREDRVYVFTRRQLRFQSSRVLIIPMLWPLAQIYPQNYLFGLGEVFPVFSAWLAGLWGQPSDGAFLAAGGIRLTPGQYWLSEAVITATGLSGAVLLLLCMLQKRMTGVFLAVWMAAGALLLKTMACALFFEPENAFVWLTPGALGGLLAALVMLVCLVFVSPALQEWFAAALLCVGLAMVNVLPGNHYFFSTLQTWSQGKFLNFNGAARFLALVWPFLALCFLVRSIYNRRHSG